MWKYEAQAIDCIRLDRQAASTCPVTSVGALQYRPALLDLPPNVLDHIGRLLSGNDRKPLRASCKELRCLANEATDYICIDVSNLRE